MSIQSRGGREGMFRIEFRDVGRNKLSWSERLTQQPTLPILERLVRKKRALMSQDIECLFAEDHRSGHIYAGMRAVGSFELLTDEVAP